MGGGSLTRRPRECWREDDSACGVGWRGIPRCAWRRSGGLVGAYVNRAELNPRIALDVRGGSFGAPFDPLFITGEEGCRR